MFNLAAGPGDPYDTFDLVTALMHEATASWLLKASTTLRAFTRSPGKSRSPPPDTSST
jgi:hypothetical protein